MKMASKINRIKRTLYKSKRRIKRLIELSFRIRSLVSIMSNSYTRFIIAKTLCSNRTSILKCNRTPRTWTWLVMVLLVGPLVIEQE